MNKKDFALIAKIIQLTDNSVEIILSDKRSIRVILDGPYQKDKIIVLYHSTEWDHKNCNFENFKYPVD